jgi:hypothetical protein
MMAGVSISDDTPVVLDAMDATDWSGQGRILAHRDGEPGFEAVTGLGDAIQAAWVRGVDLVIPASLYDQIRGNEPEQLPDWVKVV